MDEKEMFENDSDPYEYRISSIGYVKDAYMRLKKAEEGRASYEKAYEEFERAYSFLDEREKSEFIAWKYDNGYE